MSRFQCIQCVLILCVGLLTSACGSEESSEGDDVIDATADVPMCACDGGCPANMCDVRVELQSTCAGKLEEATVTVDGVVLGTVTLDAPFVSCEAWPCDATLTVQVDGTNFTTGPRELAAVLDPDVPIGCENL